MRGAALIFGCCLATLVTAPILAAPPVEARVHELGQRLRSDRSFKIRLLAAKKLGALAEGPARRAPVAIEALRIGLEDRAAIVRGMCTRALVAHEDRGALPALEQLARHDPDRAVRREARRASERLRSLPAPALARAPLRIQLGSVSLVGSNGPAGPTTRALQARLSNAVEDKILPHRPAIFPREAAHLRMDVQVERRPSPGTEVRYEVRVLLLELPKSHLRHTAKAVARAAPRGQASRALEEKVAMEAVAKAVEDVLATAIAAR